MTTVHLVRHGDAGDVHDLDPALTALGRRQAERAGAALRHVGADAVLHGSRRRVAETGRMIAQVLGHCPATHSELLEDRTPIPDDWTSVPAVHHVHLRAVPRDEADLGARQLARTIEGLSRIGDRDRVLIAVTHNFVIGWIVREVLDSPSWRWIGLNTANGAITTVRWSDDRPGQLIGFNERGHLTGLDSDVLG